MADALKTTAEASGICVWITPAMEREFVRRGMFPELRLDKAERINNGATGVHRVSQSRAAEILADAQAMRARAAELPKGTPKAYSSLARNIMEALRLEVRRGAGEAPSIDEMRQRMNESPARFEIGEACLYFRDDDEEYGTRVKVVQGFDLYRVATENGHFIGKHGRIDFRMGYVVQEDDGRSFFCRPHQLTGDDCKPSYLRLVVSSSGSPATQGARA